MIKRCLVKILVFILVFESPLVMAGSSKAVRPVVVVVALHHGAQYLQETQNIADALRKKLTENDAVEVLSRSRTEETVSQLQDPTLGTQAHDLLKKAKEHYLEFEMPKARSAAQRALQIAEGQIEKTSDARELSEIHLTLGLIDIAEEKKDSALPHFQKALFFQPDRAFTSSDYSSHILEILKEAKKESEQTETGAFEVTTDPSDAEVYVDGLHRGQSPLKIKSLPVGTHYLKLVRSGKRSVISKLDVLAQKEIQKFDLKMEEVAKEFPELSGFDLDALGIRSNNFQDLQPKIQKVASLTEAQKVVLVGLNPEKSFAGITMAVYDRDSRQIVSLQEPLPNVKKIKPQISKLADSFSSQLNKETAQKNLKKEARTAVAKQEPYIPYKKVHDGKGGKRPDDGTPLYKKPAFWVLVGVVAAGAGAGSYFGFLKGGDSSSSGVSASQSPNPNGVTVNAPAP